MKLLIFGATGGTGRELVRQARDRGYEVTAFTRQPDALQSHPGLRTVTGDVLHTTAVEQAMAGHDAVLCALGKPATSPGRLRSEGTRNIVEAMRRHGVRRLVCLSTIGIGDTRALLSPLYRYLLVPTLLSRTFAEHTRQEAIVRASDLSWTIVRAGALSDGPGTGRIRHGFPQSDRTPAMKISRTDVATFMLDEIEKGAYVHATPSVSH